MFKILQKSFSTGIVTVKYPQAPAAISEAFRGRPEFAFAHWLDARPAAEVCPTGAIAIEDHGQAREVTIDHGRCVFCGQCADVTPEGAIRITNEFELAATGR